MIRFSVFLIFVAPAAFSQQAPTEYVVLEPKAVAFFATVQTQKLEIDKNLTFKDTDRAVKAYYAYFNEPVDTRGIFRDCRAAYQPDVFDEVTRLAQHDSFPQLP